MAAARMISFLIFVAIVVYPGAAQDPGNHASTTTLPEDVIQLVQRGMTSRVHEYSYEPPSSHERCSLLYEAASSRCTVASQLFFHEEAVRVGNSFPMYFPAAVTAKLGFLQRRQAQKIPFSLSELTDILSLLHIPPDSLEAAEVETTLRLCDAPAGNMVFCVTSPEDLVERVAEMIGTRDIQVLTSAVPSAGVSLQPYTVRAVKPVQGSDFVGCHPELYPYSVYRCHVSGQSAYIMDVESLYGNGGAFSVLTMCHRNTTGWNPGHIAFKVLASKPGGLPICHFLPYGHLTFGKRVPNAYGA